MLFKPQTAWRVRWNTNTDTPLPPDEPTAPNPPEGAIINYYLKSAASGPVTLEILGADGTARAAILERRRRSYRPDPATATIPLYWYRAPHRARRPRPGMHRFTWDVHYQPLDGGGSRRRADAADCRHRSQHGAVADDAVGEPGHVHRAS